MHGLILSGVSYTKPGNPHILKSYPDVLLPELKRAPGAHRIATHLREEGWDIEVIDFIPGWTLDEFKELCKSRITKDTVFVGVSRMFPSVNRGTAGVSRMCALPRRAYSTANGIAPLLAHVKNTYPHVAIIAGSRNLISTIDLFKYADYYVTGYGEVGLSELLKKLTGKPSKCVIEKVTDEFDRVFNVVYSDKWHPAFPKKDLGIVYEDRDFIMPSEILSMELARGCIFSCKFCNFGVIGIKGDYTRSMANLDFDLRNNYDKWGTTEYYLADETINDTTEKLRGVVEIVRKLPFQTTFSGFMRGDLVASRQQDWPLISEMGLNGHFYGIETFNNAAGRYVGKGLKTDVLKQGLLDAKSYFLKNNTWHRTTISLISGLPGETEESFWDGINWLTSEYELGTPACITASPLWISSRRNPFRESYSHFERTWKDGNIFSEVVLDEMAAKYSHSIAENPKLWRSYSSPTYTGVRWSHSTMDSWTAIMLENKLQKDIDSGVVKDAIGVWHDHDYVTTGVVTSQELMKTKSTLYDKTHEIVSSWHQFIADYKHKKLSI